MYKKLGDFPKFEFVNIKKLNNWIKNKQKTRSFDKSYKNS